jgi:hypothetical protein
MPSIRLLRKTGWMTAACVGLFFLGSGVGCGRKLLPIQPGALPPPAVADLTHEVRGGDILLSWSMPPFNPGKESAVAGFKILRARQTVDETECPTCPVAFQVIGDIAASGRHPGSRMKFRDALEPGLKHLYKITSYTVDGRAGKDSNTVVAAD